MLMPSTPASCALIACLTLVHLCSTLTAGSVEVWQVRGRVEPAVSTILTPESIMTCRYLLVRREE